MTTIAQRIAAIRSTLPQSVELVAVSKFHPIEALKQAYDAGQRTFGESRVQEFVAKVPQMPDDVRWHFIGHLQTNKVKQVIGKTALIESVDSLRLLDEIDRRSEQARVVTRVLLQLHVAAEETKTGFTIDEMLNYFRTRQFENLRATHLCGVMGMASNTDNQERIAADFTAIANTHRQILEIAPDLRGFNQISMGMSHDYPIAIKKGATLVRIGTYIFGEREY
jgi:hypothetical protein